MIDAKLIVVGGDAKAAEIRLNLPTIIGRGHEATLTLPHPLVSRQHCEIFESEGVLLVRDLRSLNGTYVDNHRIESAEILQPNQLLTIGNVTFRAVYRPGVQAGATPLAGKSSVIEIDEVAAADADSKISGDFSDSIHSRPTQPGHRAVAERSEKKETAAPVQSKPRQIPLEETVDVNELQEHSVCAAMAEMGIKGVNREVSLSAIENQLPNAAQGVAERDEISIHDDENPVANRKPQSFHGLDDEESDEKVPPEDSRLGSFIRKLPR